MTSNMTPIKQFPSRDLGRSWTGSRLLAAALVYLACYSFGFLIRYRFSLPKDVVYSLGVTAPVLMLLKCLFVSLIEKWRVSVVSRLRDLDAGLAGVSLAALVFFILNHTVFPQFHCAIAKSVILIDWCLSIGLICLSRIASVDKDTENADSFSWPQVVSYSAALLILCLGLLYGSLGHQPRLNVDWFNGDALFPTHLVEDVVVDGNAASGWLFPPAPFVFPDVVFALVSRAVSHQPAVEMFLTGALLFLLIWVSACYGVGMTMSHRRSAFLLVTLGCAGVVAALSLVTTGTHLKYLFFPAYHTGTYAFAILLSALGVHLATSEEKPWLSSAAFVVIGFCAGFSDLLTIAYVSAPLTAGLFLGWLLNFVSIPRAAAISGLVWVFPLVGVYCARFSLRMYDFSTFSQRSNASTAQGAEMMLLGLLTELKQLSPLFLLAAGWLVACSVWLSVGVYRISRNTWNPKTMPVADKRRYVLLATLALSGLSTIAALVVGGNYTLLMASFDHSIRYLHPLIFTPMLFWPLLIPEAILDRLARAFPKPVLMQMGIVFLLIPLGAMVYVGKGPYRLHRYVPDYVAHLDQIAKERGLTQGVAYYWTARDVNLYSESDLRVFSVNPELAYFDWMNNRSWVSGPFDEDDVRPRPEFVILSPREVYSRETAVKYFGEPAEEIALNHTVAGYTVLIYDRDSDYQMAQQLIKPILAWGEGFYDAEASGEEEWRWCQSRGVLKIKNISSQSQPVRVEFECKIGTLPAGTLGIESSFFSGRLQAESHQAHFSQVLQVPPGEHVIQFSSEAPPLSAPNDDRALVFQIRNFKASVVPEIGI